MVQKIKFICSRCGKESWFRINIDTYIVKAKDLICDDCIPQDEETDFRIESIMHIMRRKGD